MTHYSLTLGEKGIHIQIKQHVWCNSFPIEFISSDMSKSLTKCSEKISVISKVSIIAKKRLFMRILQSIPKSLKVSKMWK